MEQQTAIEWFALKLYEKFEMRGDGKVFNEILNKAKEMEKQRLEQFYKYGLTDGYNDSFEQHYNETFKNK
jgi:hypothetical protein